MKASLLTIPILILMFACAVFSQAKPNASTGRDSMQQMMPVPAGAANGAVCANGVAPGAYCMQGNQCMVPVHYRFRHPMLFPFCILALFLTIALVNILLTILVCMDMAQHGRFKAIWIPILLLFGIPGTGLYALFRIGDNVLAAGK